MERFIVKFLEKISSDGGLNGVFDETSAHKIISNLEHINENANVG
jgi:hypothetical protein